MKTLIKSLLAIVATSTLLILMCTAFLYGWALPHLDSLRPRIEGYLSQQIGHPVLIDKIEATSSDFLPSFDVRGIRVLDAKGQPALYLGRVQASLSPTSLLTFDVSRLSIDALHLEVARDIDGQLSVAGFAISPEATTSKALDWVFSQKEIALRDGTLRWTDAQPHLMGASGALPEATFKNVSLTLKNGLRNHDIYLEATPPEAFGQSFQATGKFMQPLLETSAGRWQVWTGSVISQIQNTPLFAKQLKLQLTFPERSLVASGDGIQLAALPKLAKLLGLPLPLSTEQTAALQGEIERFNLQLLDASQPTAQARLQANFTLPDMAGDFDVTWAAKNGLIENGTVDAKGHISSINIAAVHQYLPSSIAPASKLTLQSILKKGVAKDVTFAVKGAVKDFPFTDAKQGTLRMQGKISEGHFAFDNFPALSQSSGTFDLQNLKLHLGDVNTIIANLPTKGTIQIADLRHPVVQIEAQAKGEMTHWFELVNSTGLKDLTGGALASSKGTGSVDARFQVHLPIEAMAQTKVSGSVQFLDNSLTLSSAIPPLTHLKGRVNFGKTANPAFQLQDLQATWLGGAVQVTGDSQRIIGHGSVSAEALQAWVPIPYIKGAAPYQFELDLQGLGGLVVESSLVGVQLDLPAPLAKPAATEWPLRYAQRKTSAAQDRITLAMADLVSAEFIRSLGPSPQGEVAKVLRGNLALGKGMQSLLPEQGVSAQVRLDQLDLDVWRELAIKTSAAPSSGVLTSYLPTQIAVELTNLKSFNRNFERVVLGASKIDTTWRVNADAKDFSGYAEYRPTANSEAGQLYARLKRLTVPDADSKSQIEHILVEAPPSTLPALDLVVEEFELIGKKLGRVEVNATNQRAAGYLGKGEAQEWRLQKLNITNPESELKATGVWSPTDSTNARSVDLQFNLNVTDSGDLLTRFGQPATLRGGKGNMQGRIAWIGSPLSLHYPTLTGEVKLDMAKGQFLKIDPGSGGRLMSVLSLQALPKLLTLDFQDVFSDGFAFDSFAGDAQIIKGVANSKNLQMKSVLALVSIDGTVDLAKETQNLHVLVLPDINAGGASVLATLINPVIGAVTYLTQLLIRRPAVAAATKEFKIEGSWRDPQVIDLRKK
jgi:uncharacterized protein (TIGR02099 family)